MGRGLQTVRRTSPEPKRSEMSTIAHLRTAGLRWRDHWVEARLGGDGSTMSRPS
jgi:hypothetical protein